MALVPLDLPAPVDLNHRWAAPAAVMASRGWHDVRADGRVRHHHDGGGSWVAMALLPAGRALLFGEDRDMSRTRFRGPDADLGPQETDLLDGAPQWWGEALREHLTPDLADQVAFVYGWEDGRWQRSAYDLDDGFTSLELPMLGHEDAVDELADWLEQQAEDEEVAPPQRADVEAVVVAGPGVTPELLAQVVPAHHDPRAGAEAAARFALPG